jgi:hypothetical protein
MLGLWSVHNSPIEPHTVKNETQLASQRHAGLLGATGFRDSHCPALAGDMRTCG